MALSDADIERYARQIVIPGFGAAGQASVCASALLIEGEAEGAAFARTYARAAGFRLSSNADDAALRCAILAGTGGVSRDALAVLAQLACPVVWYVVERGRIRAGVRRAPQPLPPLASGPPAEAVPSSPPLHALAAADAVATAVAVVLGWPHAEVPYEVDLA